MAVMRWARRKMNKDRRNLEAHLGNSVHSLDPGFVRPDKAKPGTMGRKGPGWDPDLDINMR